MNVAGAGILKHSGHPAAARQLIEFLASPDGQKLFADLNKEYPLHPEVAPDPALPKRESFRTAAVPLAKLGELREPAMDLIERVGLR
jgi:iron(III) transport system substrate-binding protein